MDTTGGQNEDGLAALAARLDPPVVVVTTALGERRAGCLVSFHSQCSMQPPRYALWVSRANRTFRVAALAECFAVHLLRAADGPLAALFGGVSGDEMDKFSRCAWDAGPGGVPLLRDCPNRLVGRRLAWLDTGGDHACLVLEPLEVGIAPEPFEALRFAAVRRLPPGHPAGPAA